MQQVVWNSCALYAIQNKVQPESSQDNDDGRFLDVENEEKEVMSPSGEGASQAQLEIIDFETEKTTEIEISDSVNDIDALDEDDEDDNEDWTIFEEDNDGTTGPPGLVDSSSDEESMNTGNDDDGDDSDDEPSLKELIKSMSQRAETIRIANIEQAKACEHANNK